MNLAIVVPFLNEERHLPRLLRSIEEQSRRPDVLLLVDDASTDRSPELAEAFAARHPWARVLHRPPRRRERDRLATAAELQAFTWGLEQLGVGYDVVAKVDADLEFTRQSLADLERRFEEDPQLGIAGFYLAAMASDGAPAVHRCPPEHVDGATKFYRHACFEQIGPLPAILGWDTIDEGRARWLGWQTASFHVSDGQVVHLRPMGHHDGLLRGFRRWGACAWGYGEHPLHVALVAIQRVADSPPVLGSLNYVIGWALAMLRRAPRAEPELRAFMRREQLRRIRARLAGRPRPQSLIGQPRT